jgi:hypothetical protein
MVLRDLPLIHHSKFTPWAMPHIALTRATPHTGDDIYIMDIYNIDVKGTNEGYVKELRLSGWSE